MSKVFRSLFQPAFVISVLVLAIAASLKGYTIKTLGIHFIKFPLPLKKPLDEMNEASLAPYKVINKVKITNRDIIESLGTEEYLQWELEEPDAPKNSPVQHCFLFITYYTGNPDMVPHVPDECYVGGGNKRMSGETVRIDIPPAASLDASPVQLPKDVGAQLVRFSQTGKGPIPVEKEFYVQYLFKTNGAYSSSRTETRALLGSNFTSKYSYFCKVEWKFYGFDYAGIVYPDKEQTLKASQKLLPILLPILERDHWPDWEKANRKTKES